MAGKCKEKHMPVIMLRIKHHKAYGNLIKARHRVPNLIKQYEVL